MPSESRNLPEQEISIKSRSHEVFVKAETDEPRRPTKPFPVYLRETPASPISSTVKAMLWLAGIVVALLFLASVWKLIVRYGPRRVAPSVRRTATGAVLPRAGSYCQAKSGTAGDAART